MLSRFSLRSTLFLSTLLLFSAGALSAATTQQATLDKARRQLALLARRLQQETVAGQAQANPQAEAYWAVRRFAWRHAQDPLGPLAALALGHRDFELGRYAEAERWFRQAATAREGAPGAAEANDWHLADYVEFYLAQSLAGQKKYEAAAEALANFPDQHPDSLLTETALENLATWLLEAGQGQKAIEKLMAHQLVEQRPALLLVLARAYEATNQLDQAAESYQRIYYGFPSNGQAMAAESALMRLENLLGERFPKASTARRIARADLFYTARRWQQAEKEYEGLAGMEEGAEKDHVLARLGGSLLQQEQIDRAVPFLAALKLADKPSEAERLFYLSQSYRSLDHEEEMLGIVAEATTQFPESPWTEEILFATGNYYLLENNDARAAEFYRSTAENFPNGRYAQRARWKAAWSAYLSASPEAARLLAEFIQQYPDSPLVPDALYWLGRLAEKEKYDAARPFYEALVRRFPHNYFSQDADRRIRMVGPWVNSEPAPEWLERIQEPGKLPDTDAPVPEAALARWQRYQDLRLISLDEAAVAELRAASRLAPWPPILLELARDASANGRVGEAVEALWRYYPDFFSRRVDEVPRDLWRMLFPIPYEKLIRKWSRRYRLDPLLVAALIRQESAFGPQAVSSAGAVGLMQLLPKTAKRLASERRRRFRLSHLTDPDYNLDFGCYYLAQLIKMFSAPQGEPPWRGAPELALAGYNAGEEAVGHWLEARTGEDAQTFVENIPYSQTREYVQVILRNYKLYREIYAPR